MLIADVIAEGPGIGKTFILFFTHSFINNIPGSDKEGVPASDIKDKILPSFKALITFSSSFFWFLA